MKAVFTRFFSVLTANTPPSEKRYSSRKFLSLFLILFLAVGNAWGQVTLGTYNVGSFSNPGSGTKFQKYSEEVELYMWRASSDHSFSAGTGAGKGIKTQNSQSGLIFYLNQKSNIAPIINFNASKNAADVTVTLYTISNEDYNKFQEGAVNDTKVTFSKTEYTTKTIVIENVKGNYSETIEDIPAGYYFIVCTGTASNTYFNQIQFLAPSTPAKKYSVTYDANGGGTVPTQEDVAEGTEITLAAAPTAPTGKEFAGWSDGTNTYAAGATYTMGSADVILTAQWQAETTKYAVTYDLNGSPATAPTQPSVSEGTTVTLAEAPTWEGYRFDGWLVKDENGNDVTITDGKFTMPAAKVAITAQWVKVWTVTFNTNGGSAIAPVVVDDNGTLTAPTAPQKDCYAFVEWQKGEVAYDFAATITSDITLNATWTPKYASSFDFGATTDLTKDNIMSKLSAVNMAVSVGTGGGYDNGATTGYLGYKFKNKGDKVSFLLQKGYRTIITFGFTQSGWTINGEDLGIALATKAYAEKIYTATDADVLYTLVNKSEDGKTSVITKIIIEEIPATSDDATLKDLKVNGTTIAGFNSATTIYYLTVPYGTEVANMPKITEATPNHASAAAVIYPEEGPEWEEEYGCYLQQVVVTAEDGTKGYYHVRTTVDAKQGVTIIKATHTGATTADVIGAIGGTCDKKTQSDGKLGSNGHYFGIKLAEGTFKSGDVIKVVASALNGGNTITLFADNEGTTEIGSVAYDQTTKTAYFTLTADVENVYIYRVSSACNSNVEYIEVQRYMAPFIESFVIGEAEGTIDQANKTIAIEVSASADVTALEPTIVAWANGGAKVTPTGAQDFTNPVVYSVASAYAEDGTTEYTVTVTKAAAIKEVVISGTLSVLEDETTTLSATVIDTNDAEASNQNVTWTSNDETTAIVDANGVVTGVKAGTVTITATSVEDNTKSASVTITVAVNPCRTWKNPADYITTCVVGKLQLKPVGLGTLQENMTPYQGATKTNAWKLDAKNTKYAEISFIDKAQFDGFTVGVSSNGENKNYKFAVVCSQGIGEDFDKGIIEGKTYDAVDNNEPENLINVELPVGTRAVRVYRQYEQGEVKLGGGSSVFLYYVNACKKDFVSVTTVSVNNAKLGKGKSLNLKATITPANADIESLDWCIESMTATNVTILGNVLTAAENATEGDVVVKVVATDVLGNVVEATATISIVDKFEVVKPVTATQVWNWAPVAVGEGETIADPDTVLANYISGDEWEMLAGNVGGRPYRSTSYKAYQGTSLYFKAAVPGLLIMYAGRMSDDKDVFVNGTKVGTVKSDKAYMDTIAVQAGGVYITSESMRIYWMKFDTDFASYEITDNHFNGYTREVTEGRYGTICLPNGGVMVGASIFEIAYKDASKIYFDEILNGKMEAGVPYIFLPNEGADKLAVFYTDEANASAGSKNGLVGSYTQELLETNGNNYILLNNQYCKVIGEAYVGANRAYFQLSGIPTSAPALAPGVRRVSMGMAGQNTATGVDQVQGDEVPTKMIINGQLFILRGEKMYDAQGKLVK